MTSQSSQLIPGTIYVQDYSQKRSNLYTLNIVSGRTQLVGELGAEIYDLSVVGQQLYGLKKRGRKGFGSRSTMSLIKVDPATGRSTLVGNTGFSLAGLSYNLADQKLYASAADKIVVVDTKMGQGKAVVTLKARDRVCGEIAFNRAGELFITLTGTDLKKYLATCDLTTGSVSLIGETGFPGIASMKFIDDVLYGATGNYPGLGGTNGQIVRIDTTTGKAVLFNNTIPPACWAGMAVVPSIKSQPAAENQPAENQPAKKSQPNSQPTDLATEETMTSLTIDTKENCYVINADDMKVLQESVASAYTISEGSYSIRIQSGQYQHTERSDEREPLVLLWLYGANNSSFINKTTGYEAGTTWTTLNGYNDTLRIEAKEPVFLHALFFGFTGVNNAGSVTLSIASESAPDSPQTLSIEAKKNSFLLQPKLLSQLTQQNVNSLTLTPGNYRFNIRESTASYWSEEKKFQLEPWAILLIQGGKFINNLTNAEISESWCSLNSLQDYFILEVKETTTVSGFFFDTYKEDNEGQIILDVNAVTEAEVSSEYQKAEALAASGSVTKQTIEQTAGKTFSQSTTQTSNSSSEQISKTTSQTSTSSQGTSSESTSSQGTSSQGTSSQGFNKEFAFSFQFDANQMEEVWKQVASQSEASISTQGQTQADTSYQWDQLESFITRNSQAQVKSLASQVARMEFMMKTLMQQIELSFNQTFDAWSGYFDQRLIELLDTKITTIIEDQISAKLTAQRGEERTEITRTVQSELDRRISSTLENKVVNLRNDVSASVTRDMTQSISEAIKRLEEQLALKIADQSNDINISVTKVFQNELDKQITSALESKIASLQSDLAASISKDMTQNVSETAHRLEEQLTLKVADQSEEIKALVTQNFQSELDKRINANLENKVINLRNDVSSIVNKEVTNSLTTSVKMDILADIKKQQLTFDVNAFREEMRKFYAQLAQFETKINTRISQGDTDLYNWTLEQLVTLQSCITDRQALAGLFASFSAELQDKLDNVPCVQPNRFNAWIRREDAQLQPSQSKQLAGD
ncbi:hypothetical protein [cf. Phormidesmis sp. LEGE 11477]|uniref:hypothetical protein n=1 Tax=cf. Phormidesmis sp. LEGE 11477 TaxID=1828680 RepID=UPI0018802035|nr:hypothetical protein [cf. Phormidesmis sp. LEGE 11477]MBE9063657.1 hypothetical protein [cf. Phormidesmis sp. LEGE 11477]